jgi:PAS domain S-box-containing protein
MRLDQTFFKKVASHVPAIITVYNIRTGTYEYVNDGIQSLLGYSPKEFLKGGVAFATLLVHPEDLQKITDQNLAALKKANKGKDIRATFEYRMRHKDGSWHWLQTDGSVFSRNKKGQVECVMNISIDITRRLETEDSLRTRLEQEPSMLEAIVQSSDDAIISKTLDGVIRSWNKGAEGIFGYTAQEAVGRHISLIIPKERLDEEALILSRLRQGERIDHFDTRRVRKDGSYVDISLSVSPVRNSRGEVVGASKIARDISLRKRHELVLREEEKRKDEFIAVLAHELRNPLSPISSAAAILQWTDTSSDEGQWAVDVINRQLHHMTRLIDDLLDISRITGNKLQLRKEKVAVQDFIQSAIEASEPLIQESNHKLLTAYPTHALYVEGDSVRLAQIVANLLSNAAKYTPAGGTIWLETASKGGDVVITVRDTGIGISKDALPKIFDMFVQIEESSLHNKGLGIGLTLVKRLLEMHGGGIEAHSDGLGKGSTFAVRIPKVASEKKLRGTGNIEKPLHSALKILVVDDNNDALTTLEMSLRLQGNLTEVARDGLEAVKMAQQFSPDVILLDIGMPNMNGLEAAKLIRSNTWGQSMKLIAVTGWGQDSDKKKTKEAGFDYHLTKPVSAVTLSQLLLSVAISDRK